METCILTGKTFKEMAESREISVFWPDSSGSKIGTFERVGDEYFFFPVGIISQIMDEENLKIFYKSLSELNFSYRLNNATKPERVFALEWVTYTIQSNLLIRVEREREEEINNPPVSWLESRFYHVN